MKMATPAVRREAHFTYKDYRQWPADERWELIEGTAFEMAGAGLPHQQAAGEIFYRLRDFFEGKPCRVLLAPFDVLLAASADQADDEVDTVVQPDLFVLCDPAKLRFSGARGAPDLVVEVLSPWNLRHDLQRKFVLYECSGVKEYWIVDPANRGITVFVLQGEAFADGDFYTGERVLTSVVLPGFEVGVDALFGRSEAP